MTCLDSSERAETFSSLQAESFDVIVIGGGITGAGILRDASLRGLKVALIEADDFSSGTSSKSTKLIHGGIRYLAMGQVHVVREAARERKRVHHIAPHLAEPKWLTLPARNRLEWLKYKIGVMAYERLGQVAGDDLHFDVSGADLAAHEPLLDRRAFPYATVYREYLTDDSRLVLGNIRAGVNAGGVAVNRLRVTGLVKDHGHVTGVHASCALTGENLRVRGKVVINAAGPWVEEVCGFDGVSSPKSLVLSKGVHITVSQTKVPLSQMILTVTRDKRPVFLIPRGDVVYIGTTDSHYAHAEAWPEVLPEEVHYLFEPVKQYLGIELGDDDCLGSWAGLRPLIAQRGKSTKEISRKDEIWVSDSGMITIAGGKLTGYRKMAEDTVDEACKVLGCGRPEPSDDIPLPGGDFSGSVEGVMFQLTQEFPMPDHRARRLVLLYGSECRDVAALSSAAIGDSDMIEGEVAWAIGTEGALRLEDVLYRRMRAVYYSPSQVEGILEPVSKLMATRMGWSEEGRQAELAAVRSRLAVDAAAFRK